MVTVKCDERSSPNRLDYRQGTEEEHDCNIDKQENPHAIGIGGPFLVEEKNAMSREDDDDSVGNSCNESPQHPELEVYDFWIWNDHLKGIWDQH